MRNVRGRGVTSAARTAAGRYQVIFDADVRNCGYFATVGGPTASAPPVNRKVSVSSLASNVNGVAVRIEANNGTQVDGPFHLVVLC